MPDEHRSDLSAFVQQVGDAFTVRRVFGEAYEREGTLVVPVARLVGGNGLASGHGTSELGDHGPADADPADEAPADARARPRWPHPHGRAGGAGDAGSYFTRIKPIGVYVLDDSGVHWRPALDLNRVILGGQVVGATIAVALAWAVRKHRR
ncbi:MAG TPA: hypothetical protein VGC04_10120 [Cellulomonas sp.]